MFDSGNKAVTLGPSTSSSLSFYAHAVLLHFIGEQDELNISYVEEDVEDERDLIFAEDSNNDQSYFDNIVGCIEDIVIGEKFQDLQVSRLIVCRLLTKIDTINIVL